MASLCGGANGVYFIPTNPIKLLLPITSHIQIGAPKSRSCRIVNGLVEYILKPILVAIDISDESSLYVIEFIFQCLCDFCIRRKISKKNYKCLYLQYLILIQNIIMLRRIITIITLSIFTTVLVQTQTYNTSICSAFQLENVYYKLNQKKSTTQPFSSWSSLTDQNIVTDDYIFNYCHEVEYYCTKTHKVIKASLIVPDDCLQYTQKAVQLISAGNISSGVKMIYEYSGSQELNSTINPAQIEILYPCLSNNVSQSQIWKQGCPQVERSTIFHYFNENQLGFTITVEIIGVIFMVLGVYIYRVTIVLVAGVSIFIVLMAIQIPLIFQPGVPSQLITIVLIISGLVGLFTGYIFGYFPRVGLFFLGGWIGFIISLTLNNIAFYFIQSNPANLTLWIVMPILCVLFGILSLFIKKTFIIFATSLIGAYLCLRALSWHLGAFPNQFLISREYSENIVGPVQWQFYLYVIALIILTASSSALQYWLFRKKIEKQHESKDLNEHFDNIEKQMKNKRENLVDFDKIFKKKEKGPKRLKRVSYKDSGTNSLYSEDSSDKDKSGSQDYEDQLPDAEDSSKPENKTGLKQNLIKNSKGKK